MLKAEARKLYNRKRLDLSMTDKLKWDDLILIHFQSLDLPFLDCALSYYPMEEKNEVNSILITDYLHFKNPSLQLCYPRTDAAHHTMQAVACHADSIFEANQWNILEPLDNVAVPPQMIDLVILPLLAFDANGHRVGFGKGFYDRYLQSCREDCIKVGLSYFPPVEQIEDAGEFDVPLDFCITPERAYVF